MSQIFFKFLRDKKASALILKKLSKPPGKHNRNLNDSNSLEPLFHFDEIIRFDKIVEGEKMLALCWF